MVSLARIKLSEFACPAMTGAHSLDNAYATKELTVTAQRAVEGPRRETPGSPNGSQAGAVLATAMTWPLA